MRNKYYLRPGLLLVSLILTLFIAEIIIRAFFDFRAKVIFKGDALGEKSFLKLSDDPVLLFELKYPDWDFKQFEQADKNIIILGDSLTYASGLSRPQSYPYALEGQLNQDDKGEYKYRVLNAGVPGYNLVQEVRLLERRLTHLKPDLIIVGYCAANDRTIKRIITRYEDGLYCSDVEEKIPYVLNLPFNGLLLNHWALYRFINISLSGYFYKINRPDRVKYYNLDRQVEDAISKIKAISQRMHSQLLFVIFPLLHEDSEKSPYDSSFWLSEKLDKYAIPSIYLRPYFERIGYDKIKLDAKDYMHLNELGHRVVGDIIFNYLKERKF